MLLTRTLLFGANKLSPRVLASQRSERAKSIWPRYKPKKDRYAVLDALAATVKPIHPPQIYGRGPGDPFFYRFTGLTLLQYSQHWITGKQAADYVIDRNPEFFPGFRSNPKVAPAPAPLPEKDPTVENLGKLVARRRGEESYQLFTQLRSEHPDVTIPLGLKNGLLELMLFYGVGQSWVKREKNPDKDKPRSDVDTSLVDSAFFSQSTKTWSTDCPSHTLFQEMKEEGIADVGTYIAYLHGLATYQAWEMFYSLYLEMLDLQMQPSLSIHNIFLYVVVNRCNQIQLPPEQVCRTVMRTVERMNSPPVVSPDVTTFANLMKAKVKRATTSSDLPPIYSIFHEMLSRGIAPTLRHLQFLIEFDFLNIDYVTDYIQTHPEIVRFSKDHEFNNILSRAVTISIKGKNKKHLEFYAKLNRETFGLFDYGHVGCHLICLKHKIADWDIENAKQADELCDLFREYINFSPRLDGIGVSLVKRFASIGRYDLTMKALRELFLLCEGYSYEEVAEVFAILNWFVSDILVKNESLTSDIVKEAADFMWLVIGRFERHKLGNDECFVELCTSAMKLYENIDEKRFRRVSKWLEKKRTQKENPSRGEKYYPKVRKNETAKLDSSEIYEI